MVETTLAVQVKVFLACSAYGLRAARGALGRAGAACDESGGE
jgi:hypothetical protein